MICPKCQFEQQNDMKECLKCGIVFEKYGERKNRLSGKHGSIPANTDASKNALPDEGLTSTIRDLLFHVKSTINPLYFGGRVVLFLVLFIWGWKFILSPMESLSTSKNFLHMINLPFHEAGHILFSPFGRFISVLGGSIMQLLVPFICLLTLLFKTRDAFGASVCLWWLGESFMDLAPYINDARELKLILLGGVTGRDVSDYHDWEFLLRNLGLLKYDQALASIAQALGIIFMLLTFLWGGFLLMKQYKNLQRD